MKRWFRSNVKTIMKVVLFVVGLVVLISANAAVYELANRQGKEPVTIAPTTPASGQDGRDGITPSCVLSSSCKGEKGEPGKDGEPGIGIAGFDGRNGETGAPGKPGRDGADGTDGQSIRGEPGTQGPQGIQGIPGELGVPGNPGRTPVIGCVTRRLNNVPVNYIAWRYEDEADTAYRKLYRVPVWAQPEECIDQTASAV